MKRTEQEGFLNSRDAAAYVGYKPHPMYAEDGARNNAEFDPQMHCFYAWVRRKKVPVHGDRNRRLYKREDLARAAGYLADTVPQSNLDQMATLAREKARQSCVH